MPRELEKGDLIIFMIWMNFTLLIIIGLQPNLNRDSDLASPIFLQIIAD